MKKFVIVKSWEEANYGDAVVKQVNFDKSERFYVASLDLSTIVIYCLESDLIKFFDRKTAVEISKIAGVSKRTVEGWRSGNKIGGPSQKLLINSLM